MYRRCGSKVRQMAVVWALAAWGLVHAGEMTEITVAAVNNRQMVTMQKLGAHFEKSNTDIRIKWVVMNEAELRQRVSQEVSARGAQFDVVTIGMYETPLWAARGWLREIATSDAYQVKDLIPTVRDGLSHGKRLYAAPFYGEGSMTAYRSDLLAKTGVSLVNRPTWDQIATAAAKIHNPGAGVYGICLRGSAGWGDNMALLSTMVNAFGGRWFDMAWRPQINSKPWKEAVDFYVRLLSQYGPPNAADNSFNDNLQLFAQGKCGIWVDATSVGSALIDPKFSKVAAVTQFSLAPMARSSKGAGWLWAWAFAVPVNSRNPDAAQRFVQWATSEAYVSLVAEHEGWAAIPTGTRLSTYRRPEYARISRVATTEAIAMVTADPRDPAEEKVPYTGLQFVGIPEFPEIGEMVGAEIRDALRGQQTVDQALQKAQARTERIMQAAGYYK